MKKLTVAQLKRTVKVGDIWTLVYANVPNHKYLDRPREVKVVQSNSIAFTVVGDPNPVKCWLDWPTAANFEATENGFKVYETVSRNQQPHKLLMLEYVFGVPKCESVENTTEESLSKPDTGNTESPAAT